MELFRGLFCAAGLSQQQISADALITRQPQASEQAGTGLLGPPIVEDRRLGEWDRAITDGPIAVTVWNSSGAGGLVSLARRSFDHIHPTGIETAVRDRDDPVGNVSRIAAAARELDSGMTVYVGLPGDGVLGDAGWQAAAEETEANGLWALIDGAGLQPTGLARRMSACVELDLPFRIDACSGSARESAPAQESSSAQESNSDAVLVVLFVLDRLIDGADIMEAGSLADPNEAIASIRHWDEARINRVRRRLVGFDLLDPHPVVADLIARGLAHG